MLKRTITGSLVTITWIALSIIGGWPFRFMVLFLMLKSTQEVYSAFDHISKKPIKFVGYAFCGLSWLLSSIPCLSQQFEAWQINTVLFSLIVSFFVAAAVVILRGKIDWDSLAFSFMPCIYPGVFYALMLPLTALPGRLSAIVASVASFGIAAICDTAAYLVGSRFGKHRLSSEISPKKSIEGSVAGLVASVAISAVLPSLTDLFRPLMPDTMAQEALPSAWLFALLGLVIGIVCQIGDLTASLIKRYCGIKDYGKLLPGHGGIMDRMDGVLLSAAVCYLFFRMAGVS